MTAITLIIIMAITVEALVEYIKTLFSTDSKTIILQMSALAASIILCLATGANIYGLLGVTFAYPIIGVVLTGIFASRGSNYISDFIGKLQSTGRK